LPSERNSTQAVKELGEWGQPPELPEMARLVDYDKGHKVSDFVSVLGDLAIGQASEEILRVKLREAW
jgi:hypothetical protein